jgi:hypothetical protein
MIFAAAKRQRHERNKVGFQREEDGIEETENEQSECEKDRMVVRVGLLTCNATS